MTINPKQPNYYFKLCQAGLLEEIKNALKKYDITALNEIQRLAGASVDWLRLGAGPAILSHLVRSTNEFNLRKVTLNVSKKYKYNVSLPQLRKELRGLGSIDQRLKELEDEGLVEIEIAKGNDYISLSPIWDNFLKNFQLVGREDELFIESLGKLIMAAILSKQSLNNPQALCKGGIPSGVTSMIPIMTIISEAMKNGNKVSRQFCQGEYAKTKGAGRFSRIMSRDNEKTDNQRMFESTGAIIEVKQEVVNALKRVQARANQLTQRVQRTGVMP